jgi:hypothetical protein
MARGQPAFKQRDLTRAIKAALAAGLRVAGAKINPQTGEITVVTGESAGQDSAQEGNPWDNI